MKAIIAILFIALSLVSCKKDEDNAQVFEAKAVFSNDLPSDGCSWRVFVQSEFYGPDTNSVQKISDFLANNSVKSLEFIISCQLTGKNTIVTCGWGGTQTLPEISILSIRKP
ncbi:MAG: hypothetical protein H7Y04_02785 [Verrucomicrobia bacterium]|nr:hypothetical protein [Cytophagales bacterium]